MTKVQKLQLRAAAIEKRLEEIKALPKAEQTSEIKAEVDSLVAEQMTMGGKLAAAMAEQEQHASMVGDQATRDGEFAEMAGVVAGASLAEFVERLRLKQPQEGALAELQAHYELPHNAVPVDMFRAAATTVPTNVETSEQRTVMPIFTMGEGAFLMVDSPIVPAGDAVWPILTTRPTVSDRLTDSTAVAETDGTITSELLQPGRIQAGYSYRESDSLRFDMLDPDLRSNLTSGLMEKHDERIVNELLGSENARTDATAVDTFATYRSRLVYGQIDGRWVMGEDGIRLLIASQTISHMSGQYRSNTADDSAIDSLRRITSGVRVTDHIPAPAANQQDVIVRRGMRRDFVAPIWRGVRIIFDETTRAAEGEIKLTARMFCAFKILRADGFDRVQVQHAA